MFSFLENFSTVRFFFYISFIYFSQPIVCLNKSSAVFCQEAIRHKKEPCTLAGLFLFVFSAQAALAESLAAASEEAASLEAASLATLSAASEEAASEAVLSAAVLAATLSLSAAVSSAGSPM